MLEELWKQDWAGTAERFRAWWRHEGLLLGSWGPFYGTVAPREPVADPGVPADLAVRYADPEYRASWNHHAFASASFPGDILPLARTSFGPGSFALFLGSEPGWEPDTVWYSACLTGETPEKYPALTFNPENRWFKKTLEVLKAVRNRAGGKYFVACPDLVENLDTLASLRGTENLLADMIERPEWVEEKLAEITVAWSLAYDGIHELIRLPDGSSCFEAFVLWGPGRTAKVQCDMSAMFSPRMFQRFVVPSLKAQCSFLDHSLYHLDGHQCISHLEHLLAIEELDAIEWTPDPSVPTGTDPSWIPLYRRILEAGKSVQILGGNSENIRPILDAIGGKGVYFLLWPKDQRDYEECLRIGETYRK